MKQRTFCRWPAAIIILLGMLCHVTVFAQNRQQTDLLEDKTQQKTNTPSMPLSTPALEGPIDADKYTVGPSDVLGVNIWTMTPMNLVISVTPEGTVIVPTVGEIEVSGLKLSTAKERIISEIRKKYIFGSPTVTLLKPRDFIVSIAGDVRYPGQYTMNASNRIDRLIQDANNLVKQSSGGVALDKDLPSEPNNDYHPDTATKRAIIVRHRDGSSQRVDIQKFYVERNDQWNPYLRDGDEVYVPEIDLAKNLFAVYGAVNAPGRFEFVPGDSVLDGIKLAYGYTNQANLDSVEHIRINPATGMMQSVVIRSIELFPGSPKNLALQPGDRILVRAKFDTREDFRVYVAGEVRFPGIYPITRNSTTLTQIIRLAGGLTEFASLQSGVLVRKTEKIDESQLDRMLLQRANITPEDNSYVTVEGDIKVRQENVNVDFERLFAAKDTSQDIILQSEDRIYIPSVRRTVHVFGQVVTPGDVPYVEDENVKYYIKRSGGFTDDAQEGDVAVIKWTTRQWFEPGKTKIEEGDYIWVPPVVRRPASYWLAIIGQTTSIVSVALSIVLLAIQLKK